MSQFEIKQKRRQVAWEQLLEWLNTDRGLGEAMDYVLFHIEFADLDYEDILRATNDRLRSRGIFVE